MNAKNLFSPVFVALIAITLVGTVFAASPKSMALQETPAGYNYPYYNMPDVLVFSGIAAKGETVGTAVFIALDKAQAYEISQKYLFPYKTFYMIADGKASQVKLKSAFLDKETQTIVAEFGGDREMTLAIKQHTSNYQNVVVASGIMDGYLLNMKMYGNENIYTLVPYSETTEKANVVKESAAKIDAI